MQSSSSFIIAVEIDLLDVNSGNELTLCLCSLGPLTGVVDGERVLYEPGLNSNIVLGARISVENYGQGVRATPNSGSLVFEFSERLWPYLVANGPFVVDHPGIVSPSYVWVGHEFRVYLGEGGAAKTVEDLELVYKGRVTNLAYDTQRVTITTTDARLDLDKPFVEDLYGDEAPETLRGRPKPRVDGQVLFIEPVVYDETNQLYHISTAEDAPGLDEIVVWVGGILWDEVESDPQPGQWMGDYVNGTFQLGGTPLGGEIRCDVKAVGWEELTTNVFAELIINSAGGESNSDVMSEFDADAPYLIGNYTGTSLINRQDLLDRIVSGVVGWWGINSLGEFVAAVESVPDNGFVEVELNETNIDTFKLSQIIPPGWRIRTEFNRVWNPGSQFFPAVTKDNQQKWKANGVITAAYEDTEIRDREPKAIDVPLIRTLVGDISDAEDIRDRGAELWGVPRRFFELTAYVDKLELYETVKINYMNVNGYFRVVSFNYVICGGPSSILVWG